MAAFKKRDRDFDWGADLGFQHQLYNWYGLPEGRFDDARVKLDRALEIYRAEGMNTEVSKTLNNFAQIYHKEGRFEDAIEYYKKLIVWDEKTDNRLGMAFSLWNMALIYEHYLGDHEKARTARSWSLEIFQEPGNEKYLKELQAR